MKTRDTILVTGGGGFIGANLIHRLVNLNLHPHVFMRSSRNDWRIRSVLKKIKLHQCDLTHESRVRRLVRQIKPKYIFHCATYGGYPFQTDPHQIFAANLVGTFNLVNACLENGFYGFVNTGSSSEYGFKDSPCDEKTLPEPNSDYAVSKVAATLYCRFMARSHHLPIVTFRLYSVYGPYEEPKRFIPTLIRCGLQKQSPPLVASKTARDFIHVDDVVNLYLKVLKGRLPSGEVFNVSTGRQSTVRDVVSGVSRLIGFEFKQHWGSMRRRIWDTSTWAGKNQKARKFFGWHPRENLQTGLEKTVRWYQENPQFLDVRFTAQ